MKVLHAIIEFLRLSSAIWSGWIVLAVSTVAAVALQGPYAAGSGIGDATKWSVVHDVLQTRFGHVTEVRLLLLVGALALLMFLGRIDRGGRSIGGASDNRRNRASPPDRPAAALGDRARSDRARPGAAG